MFTDVYAMAKGCDALMVITEWNEFKNLDLEQVCETMRQPVIFDGRNIYDPGTMKQLGFRYRGLGRGYDHVKIATSTDRWSSIHIVSSGHPPVFDYEGSDYQTPFWESGGREYEDRVEAIALQRLLPKSGRLLLELGAGAGRNTPRYTGFERIVLLDYSRTQLSQAQERLGSGRALYLCRSRYLPPAVRPRPVRYGHDDPHAAPHGRAPPGLEAGAPGLAARCDFYPGICQ